MFLFQEEDGIRDGHVTGVQTCALPICINLPGVAVSVPAMSEKGITDLRWGLALGADMIALSFVRDAHDMDEVLRIMQEEGRRVRSEEHTSELQSRGHLVCRLLLEKKKKSKRHTQH